MFQVSATLIYIGKFYARGEISKLLASCLDCIYCELPATVLRVQAEDILDLAEYCLEEESSNLQLKTTLFRCILISMRHCILQDEKILKLWFLAHAPDTQRDLNGPFQTAIVECLAEAIRLARLSAGEEATTAAYSAMSGEIENLNDNGQNDTKLGKRSRKIDEISQTAARSANKRRKCSEQDVPAQLGNSEDVQYSQVERMGGWKLELSVVKAGIRSISKAMDDMHEYECQRLMVENGFQQLQSALMVLNLSSCPSAWRHLLVNSSDSVYLWRRYSYLHPGMLTIFLFTSSQQFVAEMCTPIRMTKLVELGLVNIVLQVNH